MNFNDETISCQNIKFLRSKTSEPMRKMFFFKRALLCGAIFTVLPNFISAQDKKMPVDLIDMDLAELMNMQIVIASKKSEGSFTAPLSTTVLSREEIDKSGVTSIEEAFRLVPGMIVRERTNGNFDVQIRGNDNIPPQSFTIYSENTSTLIMLNGRKVFNYSNGGILWEALPISLNDIERIEIIRGPSTAMYGPNAMSGVINIVTVTPNDKKISVTGTEQYGTENTGIYYVAVGSSQFDHKLKFRVGGNYEKRDRTTTDYYNWFQGKYVPRESIVGYSGGSVPNSDKIYEDTELAKDCKGVMVSATYDPSADINFVIDGGFQESVAQSIYMETQSTTISRRLTRSKYVNLSAKIHGLEINASNTQGFQDLFVGNPASELNYNIVDATVEYNFELGDLLLRPGVSHQRAMYSDLDFSGASGGGYLNASRALSTSACYLRGDYNLTENLRLIGALRMDRYDIPDKSFLSYQATATYSINDNNFIRASYGKANKGPVMVDFYADYHQRLGVYRGNPSLDLTYNNTVELGYRLMALRNLSFDAEIFYSETNDITAFTPVSVSPTNGLLMTYKNLDLSSQILGGSLSVNYIISSQYQAKLWCGYSDAQLKNYDEKISPLLPPSAPSFPGVMPTFERKDIANPQSPNLYGGASFTAQPINKLTANLDCYYLGKHEYVHDFDSYVKTYTAMFPGFSGLGRTTVDARLTFNLKVGYNCYKHNQVFVNCRNLLNNKAVEFGFSDPIGGVYLIGLKLDL